MSPVGSDNPYTQESTMIRTQHVTANEPTPATMAGHTGINTTAAVRDGAHMLGRAIAGGVAAALILSAMTLALTGRAYAAPTTPVAAVTQLAPVNAIASELYVAAGDRLVRAAITRTTVEVTILADRVHYMATRVFVVEGTTHGVLTLPLTGDSTVEQVTVQGRDMHYEAMGARNDAGYREDMLIDTREQSRLTYALGALQGPISVTIEWSRPLTGADVTLAVPLKNTHDRWLPATDLRDADADDSGCGGPLEPMMWTVHIDPIWDVDPPRLAESAGAEQSKDGSWLWSAGAFDIAPPSVSLFLRKQNRPANNATIVATR
jgi:hypothetical protein